MRTYSLIHELAVFDISNGEEIGKIIDLFFDENSRVTGLLMDKKGWLNSDMFVPLHAIQSIGQDGVMVKEKCLLENFSKSKHVFHSLKHKDGIVGKPLVTAEGEKLGLVEDVYFLEEKGTIIGYEVTDGLFADLIEGRKVVKTDDPLLIGEDILVVNINP
ncbi:PRC-barrel domain-containing protein [Anaerobacillus sp. MEB173]|uniref:PRC-barrel domain-containing protein n=1 Tax=Anaerobacillus sp. MEB173 TaxID=3383345 RepID=UPI003F91E0C1